MLRYPCLVLDHDDTVVQSEATIHYPYFCYILEHFRPGETLTLAEYTQGCFASGFAQMCRDRYQFTQEELTEEYLGWKDYVRNNIPLPYPGIETIIHRQKEAGGLLCVVSHSSAETIERDYLTHFSLRPDAIYGWDFPEHQRKPSVYPLRQIMDTYSLRPRDLLVVDDMMPGCEMARKANVLVAFAAWGRRMYPQLCESMEKLCDFTFETVSQLEHFLFDSP